METASLEVYVDAFVARCRRVQRPGQTLVHEPGAYGLVADTDGGPVRLLVTDDRALDVVAAHPPASRAGTIKVLDAATRCRELVLGHPAWSRGTVSRATLMGTGDLSSVPGGPVPMGLTLRRIRRLPNDPPDLVPLDEAIALVLRAEPSVPIPATVLAEEFRTLPAAVRLFAALDEDGAVRATSGSAVFGTQADVLFVDTDPDWRGHGIARAMTAAALRDATARGARVALLDATDAGVGIYRRLGFEVLALATRFDRYEDGESSAPSGG